MKLTKKIITTKERSFLSINIRFLRKMNNMTQERYANKFKVSRGILAAYEEDRAKPPYEFLIKVSDWHGVTIDDMLKKEITSVYPK